MWERLAAGIKEIQNHNASSLSYEEHYRYAYNMVLYKRELDLCIASGTAGMSKLCEID